MQERQFDALKAAFDPKELTESRKVKDKGGDEELREDAPEWQEETVVNIDEFVAARAAAARKTPLSARMAAITEACDGNRDPDLAKQ